MSRDAPRVVFLITTGLGYGGAETQVVRIAKELRRRGWDSRIISMLPAEGLVCEVGEAGIPFVTLGMKRGGLSLSAPFALLKLLRDWKPDVLVTFLFHANLLGRIAGRLARIPVVVSSVRSDNFGGEHRYRLLALTDRLAHATTTNSHAVADRLVSRGVVAHARIRVVPNGIDLAPPRADERASVREELGISRGEFLWTAVGRLDPSKDYPTLLNAFHLVVQSEAAARLVILGEGPLETELKELASSLGLSERVRFLGLRRDVMRVLSGGDAYVISSSFEGLPNSLLEAHSAGLAAVGTRVGGVPELIVDGVSGHLVPPADPDALATAMRTLMCSSEERRSAMGRAAMAHVHATFGLERVADQWEELFEELGRYSCAGERGLENRPSCRGTSAAGRTEGARQILRDHE